MLIFHSISFQRSTLKGKNEVHTIIDRELHQLDAVRDNWFKRDVILASQFIAKFTEQSQSEVDTKRRSKFDNRFAVDNIDRLLEQ